MSKPAKGKTRAQKTPASKKKPKATRPKKGARKAPPPEQKPKRVPKAKKEVEKKGAPAKPLVTKAIELGPPPTAMVVSRHIDSLRERAARGFSFGELESAGIPLNTAKSKDLSIDVRRRSVLEQNVGKLKAWFNSSAGKITGA